MEVNPLAIGPGDPALWRLAYCLPNFLGGLGMWLVAGLAWPHRHSRGGWPFIVFAGAAGIWSLCEGLSFVGLSPASVLLAWKIQYLGNTLAPLSLVVFALTYVGYGHFLTPSRLLLAALLPEITALAAWTNEMHHLIWVRTWVDETTHFPTLANQHGPLVWVYFAYANLLMAGGGVFLLYARRSLPELQRQQIRAIFLATLVPMAASTVYVARLSPWPNMDLAASALCISGLVLAHSFLRERFFSLVPVARDEIYQSLNDAVFVTDRLGRLADCNQAARELLGTGPVSPIGRSFAQLIPGFVVPIPGHATPGQERPGPTPASAERFFDVQVSPLQTRDGEQLGQLLVWRDISERKRLADELVRLASRDPLTGIYNRRALNTRLRLEIARARRYGRSLAILLLDIDFFKRVNDTHGHHWGDVVLKGLAEACPGLLRESDMFGRWGGEEFLIVLPETPAEAALEVAQRLLEAIRRLQFMAPSGTFGITVSLGVGNWQRQDRSADAFLNRVDQALYRAKSEGRDRVVVASVEPAA